MLHRISLSSSFGLRFGSYQFRVGLIFAAWARFLSDPSSPSSLAFFLSSSLTPFIPHFFPDDRPLPRLGADRILGLDVDVLLRPLAPSGLFP